MKYAVENCPKVNYVVHVDDDAYRKILKKFLNSKNYVEMCDLNIIKPNDVDLTLQRQ